jgi:hypothetical protein
MSFDFVKKLNHWQWMAFFAAGPQGKQSVTWSCCCRAKSKTMMQMEDIVCPIMECKQTVEVQTRQVERGTEGAAAREQLKEALQGCKPRQQRAGNSAPEEQGSVQQRSAPNCNRQHGSSCI